MYHHEFPEERKKMFRTFFDYRTFSTFRTLFFPSSHLFPGKRKSKIRWNIYQGNCFHLIDIWNNMLPVYRIKLINLITISYYLFIDFHQFDLVFFCFIFLHLFSWSINCSCWWWFRLIIITEWKDSWLLILWFRFKWIKDWDWEETNW